MLIGSRCPKEIRLCPGCKHQVVALVFLSLCSFSGSRLEINRDHFAQLYIHVGMALEDAAQRKRRIARRQYGGRHLVEQRVELLIVILIYERESNIIWH